MQANKVTFLHSPHPLITPSRKIKVHLAGIGGNGTQILTDLGRLDLMMRTISGGSLDVTAYDADIVSEANCGRQLFASSEIGMNKAVAFVERVNKFFGLRWTSVPEFLNEETSDGVFSSMHFDNSAPIIVITCVDTAKARVEIGALLKKSGSSIYWLDIGNTQLTGQVVLGTTGYPISYKPNETSMLTLERLVMAPTVGVIQKLPTVLELFPDIEQFDTIEEQGPSCSVAEALRRQSLYINKVISGTAMKLLTDLIMAPFLTEHGVVVNLKEYMMGPLKIHPKEWEQRGFYTSIITREGEVADADNVKPFASLEENLPMPHLDQTTGLIDGIGNYNDNQLLACAGQFYPATNANSEEDHWATHTRFLFAVFKLMQHLTTVGAQPSVTSIIESPESLLKMLRLCHVDIINLFTFFLRAPGRLENEIASIRQILSGHVYISDEAESSVQGNSE
jgi:PRTRC genetic system ThiF family protein